MPKYFVYILESLDGRYYTGYTSNLEKRMEVHKSGKGAKFVKAFGFKKLLYHEELESQSEAMKREVQIKRYSRAQKKTLIRKRSHLT